MVVTSACSSDSAPVDPGTSAATDGGVASDAPTLEGSSPQDAGPGPTVDGLCSAHRPEQAELQVPGAQDRAHAAPASRRPLVQRLCAGELRPEGRAHRRRDHARAGFERRPRADRALEADRRHRARTSCSSRRRARARRPTATSTSATGRPPTSTRSSTIMTLVDDCYDVFPKKHILWGFSEGTFYGYLLGIGAAEQLLGARHGRRQHLLRAAERLPALAPRRGRSR